MRYSRNVVRNFTSLFHELALLLLSYSHISLKTKGSILRRVTRVLGGVMQLSEKKEVEKKEVDIAEKMHEIAEKMSKYKSEVVATFKDMEVDVKDWKFSVNKVEKEYNVEVNLKLTVKPKKIEGKKE